MFETGFGGSTVKSRKEYTFAIQSLSELLGFTERCDLFVGIRLTQKLSRRFNEVTYKLKKKLKPVGVRVTKACVYRIALSIGLDELERRMDEIKEKADDA